MEVVDFLGREDLIVKIVGVNIAVIYALAFTYFMTEVRRHRRLKELKLNNAISSGLSNGVLVSVDDFVNIYKGVYGLRGDDISYRAGLAKALRKYIVQLVSDDEVDESNVIQLKDAASAVLARIEAESPFAGLPPAERNLLIDVEGFVKANDQQSALRKLEDLASLIEVRQDSLERVQASNKWSIPLAVAGLFITIIFGIFSVFK